MTEKMAEQVPDTFPCIFCQHPINPADWDWKCPCCGHFNAHGSIFKICEECRFSPSRFPCPGCDREFDFMVLLGNYGIYEVSKVPIYGLTDELLQAVPQLFACSCSYLSRLLMARKLLFMQQGHRISWFMRPLAFFGNASTNHFGCE